MSTCCAAVAAADHLQRGAARGREVAEQPPARAGGKRDSAQDGRGRQRRRRRGSSPPPPRARAIRRDNVRRLALAQIFAECRLGARDMAAGHQGLRQMRARRQAGMLLPRRPAVPHPAARACRGARKSCACGRAAARPCDASMSQSQGETGIDPQPQHVNGLGTPGGRDFHARHQLHARARTAASRASSRPATVS